MEDVIKVQALTKRYGEHAALCGLSFRVKRGTVFGLLGENGAGKSTSIECILGIKALDGGTVSLLGQNPQTRRKQLFARVGVQLQEGSYQEKITVGELCEVTRALYGHPADPADLLRQFELQDRIKSPVSELSGGQRQRLFLVLALLPNPEVLFLDELTTGLDTKARRKVWKQLLQRKREGLTVLLTSHFMDEVALLCDEIGIVKEGRMAFCGTVAEAVERSPYDNLEEAYLWHIEKEGEE